MLRKARQQQQQHNRKAKQHNTTRLKRSFFKEKLAASGGTQPSAFHVHVIQNTLSPTVYILLGAYLRMYVYHKYIVGLNLYALFSLCSISLPWCMCTSEGHACQWSSTTEVTSLLLCKSTCAVNIQSIMCQYLHMSSHNVCYTCNIEHVFSVDVCTRAQYLNKCPYKCSNALMVHTICGNIESMGKNALIKRM